MRSITEDYLQARGAPELLLAGFVALHGAGPSKARIWVPTWRLMGLSNYLIIGLITRIVIGLTHSRPARETIHRLTNPVNPFPLILNPPNPPISNPPNIVPICNKGEVLL